MRCPEHKNQRDTPSLGAHAKSRQKCGLKIMGFCDGSMAASVASGKSSHLCEPVLTFASGIVKIQAPRALREMADEESCPGSSSHLIEEPDLSDCKCLCSRSPRPEQRPPGSQVLGSWRSRRPGRDLQGWEGFSLVLPCRGLARLLLRTLEEKLAMAPESQANSSSAIHSCVALYRRLPSRNSVSSSVKGT